MRPPTKSWITAALLVSLHPGWAQSVGVAPAGGRGPPPVLAAPAAPKPGATVAPRPDWNGWLQAAAPTKEAGSVPPPVAAATADPKDVPSPTGPAASPEKLTTVERTSLLRIGATKLKSGDADSAIIAYRQVAEITEEPGEEAAALAGLARAYRLGGDQIKAAATYELFIKDHPDDPQAPAVYLELGRTLRDLGSPKLAIASFYNVLQSALRFPDSGSDEYRRLALTAQFEIAETHLATGEYAEAVRFFNRLNVLDLSDADRARARFKSAQAMALSGNRPAAILALQAFIKQDPDDPNSPEARFLLATILGELNRREESLQVTLDLLHHEHDRSTGDAAGWRTWQQRTGNQLANQFYTQGDFASALVLYRALAGLDATAAWRLPVLYQIGLCDERLLQNKDALDIYQQIITLAGKQPGEFADFARMAAWRSQQLTWWTQTQSELNSLITPPPPGLAAAIHP